MINSSTVIVPITPRCVPRKSNTSFGGRGRTVSSCFWSTRNTSPLCFGIFVRHHHYAKLLERSYTNYLDVCRISASLQLDYYPLLLVICSFFKFLVEHFHHDSLQQPRLILANIRRGRRRRSSGKACFAWFGRLHTVLSQLLLALLFLPQLQ